VSPRDDIIRASEIAQYAYCARAWWLGRVKGYRSANVAAMRQGTVRHRTHGRAVEGYHLLRRLAVALIVLAGVVLVAWLLLSLGG
jgi:CRISPR/Cas system-associated exonuclease Cas4 (RecB family)